MIQLIHDRVEPVIFDLVCNRYGPAAKHTKSNESGDDEAQKHVDLEWVDCWAGCLHVTVKNGKTVSAVAQCCRRRLKELTGKTRTGRCTRKAIYGSASSIHTGGVAYDSGSCTTCCFFIQWHTRFVSYVWISS